MAPYLQLRRREAKRLIEAAYICDGRVIEVKGFLPQSFSQSETTYGILDRVGIEYDAGYQAGLIFEPGHENDSWLYPVEDRNFSAVPMSTHLLSGELVPLSDRFAKEVLKLSGPEWQDLLASEFDECVERGDPMVVIFTNVVAGQDEGYMEAYRNFVDYATSKDANFVSTLELVEMARSRAGQIKSGNSRGPQSSSVFFFVPPQRGSSPNLSCHHLSYAPTAFSLFISSSPKGYS